MISRALTLASGLIISASTLALAQGADAGTARPLKGRGAAVRPEKAPRQAKAAAAAGNTAQQQRLARQIRQAFAGRVRQRLNLNDTQSQQLSATEKRFNQQRNVVLQSERQARLGLKAAMQDSSGTRDQTKINQYMDQLVQAQHRRADILEAEQKEMAGYLTPYQRAQYQALQQQLNKRITQFRQDGSPNEPPTP
ncbi:MAG TPA: Spy/CpxP family protein refolding chaperone [Gemmatimonadaceae bacterium]|jgi:hypothetical protein